MTQYSIGGFIVTSLGLLTELALDVRDLAQWDERDLVVDQKWLEHAVHVGLLPGPIESYTWSKDEAVAIREIAGTHTVVTALNGERRVKYRLTRGIRAPGGGFSVLIKATP